MARKGPPPVIKGERVKGITFNLSSHHIRLLSLVCEFEKKSASHLVRAWIFREAGRILTDKDNKGLLANRLALVENQAAESLAILTELEQSADA